jgi:hypothetical protein
MRLIDGDALDAKIYNDIPIKVFGTVARMANMRELVNKQPTVDAAPVKHGRWIKGGYACGENEYKCSACGETEWRTGCKRMKYCMYCGAKMDLEDEQ